MKKFLKFLAIFLVVFSLIVFAILLFVGIMPGIAKPVDLGAKNDPAFISKFDSEHGMKNTIPGGVATNDRQVEFSGETKLDVNLTGDEVTSILNSWKSRSPALPIKNIQVRFNNDGTGEISGILEIKTAIKLAKLLNYNDSDIEQGKKYIKYSVGDIPFYAKGTANIANNNVTINPTDLRAGNISLPKSMSDPAISVIEDAIEKRLTQVKTINVQSLDISKGSMHFVGTVPDTVK